eukprot:10517136-Karenia_brevis.AAC.1
MLQLLPSPNGVPESAFEMSCEPSEGRKGFGLVHVTSQSTGSGCANQNRSVRRFDSLGRPRAPWLGPALAQYK